MTLDNLKAVHFRRYNERFAMQVKNIIVVNSVRGSFDKNMDNNIPEYEKARILWSKNSND